MKNKKILLLLFAIVTLHVSIFAEKECPVCKKSVSNLKTHMRTHTGERPYVCRVCKKGFAASGDLTKHMRTHTGERPYVCQECNKGFTTNSSLIVHMRTHTKKRPFVCQECNKGFTQKGNLTRHMQMHTGEKPYTCEICNTSFSLRDYLEKHIKSNKHKNKALSRSVMSGTEDIYKKSLSDDDLIQIMSTLVKNMEN